MKLIFKNLVMQVIQDIDYENCLIGHFGNITHTISWAQFSNNLHLNVSIVTLVHFPNADICVHSCICACMHLCMYLHRHT